MSFRGFNRGRGYGARRARGHAAFIRPSFPHATFRYMGPPRPAYPGSFVPWPPGNMFCRPPFMRGNPQFRPRGRGKRIYEDQLIDPTRIPPVVSDYEEDLPPPPLPPPPLSSNSQIENNSMDSAPQLPLLGSKEEREQKITETVDRLKQKLSCFSNDEMVDIRNDDVSPSPDVIEDNCAENINPQLQYKPEISLMCSDSNDVEGMSTDNLRLNTSPLETNVFSIMNNTDNDVILDRCENRSQLEAISSPQMPVLDNPPNNSEYAESENWETVRKNLGRLNLCEDSEIANKSLLDFEPESDIPQDQCNQQQDILQKTELDPVDTAKEHACVSKRLQDIPLPTDLTNENTSEKNMSQNVTQLISSVETENAMVDSHTSVKSSISDSYTPPLSTSTSPSELNNITYGYRSSRAKENFHSKPPILSPHTEQELPIDFDPSTPPPTLLKQDQLCASSPYALYNLPPLFNPMEPPPNMRHAFEPKMCHINTENNFSTVFDNKEVHAELNMHERYTSQQLPLNVSSQDNIFLPPHIDTINVPPLFSMQSSHYATIETNDSLLLQTSHNTPHNTSSSTLHRGDINIDNESNMDNEMQQATRFAKEMLNMMKERDEKTSSGSCLESSAVVESVNNLEAIFLPPDKPKNKSNKLKRTKNNSKQKPVPEKMSNHVSSGEIEAQAKCSKHKDISLEQEKDRPKVVFNLDNKAKKISTNKTAWQDISKKEYSKKKDAMQIVEIDETRTTSLVTKKNDENTLKRSEAEKRTLKKNESNLENIVLPDLSNQTTISLRKRIPKDVSITRSPRSSVPLYQRINTQKSLGNHVKRKSSNLEASWKTKIINRFLKMSKNEIYNMVNNTSLRKFDVIMKHLVKEKRPALSLEMRHEQDEKMRLYDQQDFMKQLNAMLDPDATVAIRDLPTEFIHHLNEVLQLDVLPSNQAESAATPIDQIGRSEDTDDTFQPIDHIATEHVNRTAVISSDVNQDCTRNKDHATKEYDKDTQAQIVRINDLSWKDDACSTKSNKSSNSGKLSTLQHDLDDIFSEVTKKSQAISRKHYKNSKNVDEDKTPKSIQRETRLEDDKARKSENCARWLEKCDKWKKKEQEDPYAYRNLTKEEWEAKYGTAANLVSVPSIVKKIDDKSDDKSSSNKMCVKNLHSRRRHSSESSKHSSARHKTVENDKHKRSRRHSNDREHTAEYSEDDHSKSSRSSSSSSSSSSNSNNSSSKSSSSNSSDKREPNVTKLLRVIKEKEKLAKKMSLNETIRDEVNAEIERERRRKLRKSKKSHKGVKRQKKKKSRKRNERRRKRFPRANSLDFSLQNSSKQEVTKLLTENEIKKEVIENQVTCQEVVIKEELDINQEENTRDAEFANNSNRHTSLISESNDKSEFSPVTKETSTMITTDAVQSYAEDKLAASLTQPKTKAQLKQMPEPAKIDNRNPSPTDTSKCSKNLNIQVSTDIESSNGNAELSSTINHFIDKNDNIDHDKSDENTMSEQLGATICASIEPPANTINIPGNNKVSVSADASSEISASSISGTSMANAVTQRTSKKIDIKTYYERTIQRRLNEQDESKRIKATKDFAAATQNSLTVPKIAKVKETAINKSIASSACDSFIQDPRSTTPCSTIHKDDIASLTKDIRQERDTRQIMESEAAESTLKHSARYSTVNVNNVEESKYQSKDEAPLTVNADIDSNVVTIPKTTSLKSKKRVKVRIKVMDKKLCNQVLSDPKKFKNIRSEGSKELKLKETAKMQKTKKKPVIISSTTNLVSAKIYYPETLKMANTDKIIQDKEIGDINNVKIKQTVKFLNPFKDEINNDSTEITEIFSKNTNDDNSKLSHESDKIKEYSLNLQIDESKNTDKNVNNIESSDAREQSSSETMQKCGNNYNKKHINNTMDIEIATKENHNSKISCILPEFDVPMTPEIETENFSKENSPSLSEIKQHNVMKNLDLSLNHTNQIHTEGSNEQDTSENTNDPAPIKEHDMSGTFEADVASKLDVDIMTPGGTCKSVSSDENGSSIKITATPSVSDKNSHDRNIQDGTISPDSKGSPFKGFLQESPIMDFKQINLFNFESDDTDAVKENKLLLDNSIIIRQDNSVNCVTAADNCKETETEEQNYKNLSEPFASYTSDIGINANENFNIIFDDTLLSSYKESAMNEKSDKSNLITDEERERRVEEHLNEVEREDENVNSEEKEKEKEFSNEEKYILNTEVTIREAVFINEEETIQDETQPRDLTCKLTTTADPSLSDAVDTTASDEALRVPEIQNTEHFDDHLYSEVHTPAKRNSCDKLPGFDSDEQLDNDMFYLDVRLQDTTTFDNKDSTSAHFSDHQQSPRYEDTAPVVTPETTMIVPCSDSLHDEMQKSEQYKFDFKNISSMDNDRDLLTRMPVECSPTAIDMLKTLNIPTKAALKEATINPSLKSSNNTSTATEEVGILENTQHNEVNLSYEVPACHLNTQDNAEACSQEAQNDGTNTMQDFTNINAISSTQSDATDAQCINTDQTVPLTLSINVEKCLYDSMQRTPIVELKKMKELDNMAEKRVQEISRKIEEKDRREGKSSILHTLKNNRPLKYQPKKLSKNLKKKLKKIKRPKQFEKVGNTTRESIFARMLEIDLEMHKLTKEKLKLHEMLRSETLSVKDTISNDGEISERKESDAASTCPKVLSTFAPQLTLDTETNKQKESIKQKKRTISYSSEDDEIIHYTPKKMPVIRWKKIPRLELLKREEHKKEENNERTEQQIASSAISKSTDDPISASDNVVHNVPPSDSMMDHSMDSRQLEKTNGKIDKKIEGDKSLDLAICLNKNTENSSEKEIKGARDLHESDIDKKNDSLAASDSTRTHFQLSTQMHGTPEPLSIYSDDSTWDSLVQNTASEMHEKRKSIGTTLPEESFKKLTVSRKMKEDVRRQKKKQLNNFLKSVNNLTVKEEKLPLTKLYIKKLQQKRDLLDLLSQKKEDASTAAAVDPKVMENMDEVINAVAENRVEDLYESRPEVQEAPRDIATTSSISVSQSEKHRFYVDVEANANSDWPCTEEMTLQQQNDNDISGMDGSNCTFMSVNQNKVSSYDERNVEPDSSVTPEETVMENNSLVCEPVCLKETNNTAVRSFDIKVSVPKVLIKDNFSLGLLQKLKNTGSGVTELVDSTTNALVINAEKLTKNDEDIQNSLQTTESIVGESKSEEKALIEKSKHAINVNSNKQNAPTCESLKQKTTVSMKNVQLDTTESKSRVNEHESLSNSCDILALKDSTSDSRSSDSSMSAKTIHTEQKKSDAESEEITITSERDQQNIGSITVEQEGKNYPEKKSYASEEILDDNPISVDLGSEKLAESNETFIEGKCNPDRTTSASILSLDKAITAIKNIDADKKVNRRKHGKLTVVRRSSRYTNENLKPNKMHEADANSNSEQELSVPERDLTIHYGSKSPMWTMREEKIMNTSLNAKKCHATQKTQQTSTRKVLADAEPEAKIENKPHLIANEESTTLRNKTTIVNRKRKQHTNWQIMNCKVRLVDCKHILFKQNVSTKDLHKVKIAADPCTSNRALCTDQDIAIISTAAAETSSSLSDRRGDKNEVKIVEIKTTIKNNNFDQGPALHTTEIEEQEPERIQYTDHRGSILDLKIFENSLLAACEDGKIYRYSQASNAILNIYKGHKSAVTCLHIYKTDVARTRKELFYSGSLDGTVRCYNILTGALVKSPAQISNPIQCMDEAWGMIFVGTKSGLVSRFHIKTNTIKGSAIHFSDTAVFALKATNEGPRKILIAASRHQPIIIRDAQSGLFLRSVSTQKNHTVYSLICHNNLIYCGTSNASINVFDFTTGEQVIQYNASLGVVCLRVYKQLLLAGCYDGNIYVFDTMNHRLVCSIPGPGNMLLSLEVVDNKIIAGSKDRRLHSWQMPLQVRALLHKIA